MTWILDRYILKKLIFALFFIVLGIVGIIEIIHFVMNFDYYVDYNLKPAEVAKYYATLLPFLINYILPISTFITTTYVTLRLARNSEVIAMSSSGISYKRFIVPYVIFSLLVGILSIGLCEWMVPSANRFRIVFEVNYLHRHQYSSLYDIHLKVGQNKYLYLKYYDPYTNTGENFTLELLDGKMRRKLSAKKLIWNKKKYSWEIEEWTLRTVDGMNEDLTHGLAKRLPLNLLPSDFGDDFTIRIMLTYNQLRDYINNLKDKDSDALYLFEIEKYLRYMYPVSILLLVLMGIMFSSRSMRSGVFWQIAISFILGLTYVAFFMVSKGRAETHKDNILLTLWTPNILFSFIVGVIYRFMPK